MIPSDVQREAFDESNLCIRVQTINIHMLGIHNIDNRQKPRVEFMICFEFLSLTQSYPGLHLRFMVNKFRFTVLRTRQRICRDFYARSWRI